MLDVEQSIILEVNMDIKVKVEGDFGKTRKFLKNLLDSKTRVRNILEKYGAMGVDALADATPVNTGLTSESWSYEIIETDKGFELAWKNSNIVDGWYNVAILIQYGHGTRNGGYVQGNDYINPAMKPIFDELSKKIGKEGYGISYGL